MRCSTVSKRTISQGHTLSLMAHIPIVVVYQGRNVWDRRVIYSRRPFSEVTGLAWFNYLHTAINRLVLE